MSEAAPHRTVADTRQSWGPGWIWAVPIAAIGVVVWLLVRGLAQGGEQVTVLFDDAYGLKQSGAPVMLRGVKVGEVASVALDRNDQGVKVKLRLDHAVGRYLRSGTRFWLVGGKFDLADLSSVRALLSGPQIGMEPGPGQPAHVFRGLDQPPAVPVAQAGTSFALTADSPGSLQAGSSVIYDDKAVGEVTDVRFLGPHRFEVDVFIDAPFDALVSANTRFWNAGALQVSATSSGVKAQLVSPAALIGGALAFDTPAGAPAAPRAAAGTSFPLYEDKAAADGAPVGPQVEYFVSFPGAVGGLKPGAPVMMRGFRVGRVTSVRLTYDAAAGVLRAPVGVAIEPALLDIENGQAPADGNWRAVVDDMLRRLIAQGLRARLAQDPPVIGARRVDLVFAPNARRASLAEVGGREMIPATASGDISSIAAHADQVLTQVQQVPFAQIGANVRQITARIRTLASSPQVSDSLDHLDRTLAEADRVVHQAGPQVGPLVVKLRLAADQADQTVAAAKQVIAGDPTRQDSDLPSALHELTDAARSIRVLADYLDRHPEALVEGKAKQKASPNQKASQ